MHGSRQHYESRQPVPLDSTSSSPTTDRQTDREYRFYITTFTFIILKTDLKYWLFFSSKSIRNVIQK